MGGRRGAHAVIQNAQENIGKALDLVAAGAGKLEQAVADMAPHVWDAEVRYHRWIGVGNIATAVVTLAITVPLAVLMLKRAAARMKATESHYDPEAGMLAGVGGVAASVLACIVLGTLVFCGSENVARCFAPEMFAIRDLLEILK